MPATSRLLHTAVAPQEGLQMYKIEDVLRNFTNQIPEIRKESYWDRLRVLKMNSEIRRIERYKIMYIWKVMEMKLPNPGIQSVPLYEHRGSMYVMFLSQDIIKE